MTFGRPGNADPRGKNGTYAISLAAPVEHGGVVAVEQAEGVLHTDDAGGLDRNLDLVEGRVGDPDPADLALLPHCDHLGELVLERDGPDTVGKLIVGHPAQVHRPQLLHAEGAQVLLHSGAQLCRCLRGDPAAVVVTLSSHLGNQEEVLGVGVQRVVDQLVRHVGPVVLRGVDVVHTQLDRAAQHRERLVAVTRRTRYSGTGELHGAEPNPADNATAE